jgi:hypothetical protein
MAESNLILHKGARLVEEAELSECRAPPPQGRWYPVAHGAVLATVKTTLEAAGYQVQRQKLGLSPCNQRFFGTLDLATTLSTGVTLAVGVRNSTDKSFPLGFAAGSRVFCCDNLAFRSELMVRRKHTRFGSERFGSDIAEAVSHLPSFQEEEGRRIRSLQQTELKPELADALILRAFEQGMIGARELPGVIKEWRTPSFEDFEERTAWSLLSAFTTVLRTRSQTQPQSFLVQTMRLQALLDRECHHAQAT